LALADAPHDLRINDIAPGQHGQFVQPAAATNWRV
jgi:hypothetical protein